LNGITSYKKFNKRPISTLAIFPSLSVIGPVKK
jgi:hypothetical protein